MRATFILAISAMFLQIAVFIQPLLPANLQISPVCETISESFSQSTAEQHMSMASMQNMTSMDHMKMPASSHHNDKHECIFCSVYGHLVAFLDFDIKEILDRVQIRLIAFQKAFKHIYFCLQRLFLLPQGRAPPLFI